MLAFLSLFLKFYLTLQSQTKFYKANVKRLRF